MKTKLLFILMSIGILLPATAQNIPSYLSKDGIVGWWPFNGNPNDESGNGNNGVVNRANLTDDRNGKANCAYNFNSSVFNNITLKCVYFLGHFSKLFY